MNLPAPIADYWAARSPRERRLLALLGLVAGGLLVWYGLVSPLRGAAEDAANDRAASVRRLTEAEGHAAAIRKARPRGGPLGPDRLDALLTETAAAAGVSPDRKTPVAGGVRVEIEAVSATALFGWIAALDARGVRATDVAVLRGDGTVRASVTFAG